MNIKQIIKEAINFPNSNQDTRDKLLEMMPKNSICIEIGVWKGEFSKKIVQTTSPRTLHLVDPWKYQEEFSNRMYGGKVAKSQKDMDEIYEKIVGLFSDNSHVNIHRDYSNNVADSFSGEYFDWIYIDGNHYYEYVLEDLEGYFSKIKKSGFITGDDYLWSSEELGGDKPVKRAVKDFIEMKKGEVEMYKVFGSQFILRKCV